MSVTQAEAAALLEQALELSRELLRMADRGDLSRAARIDAERRQLLHAARSAARPLCSQDLLLVGEITALNNQALGMIEHRLRIKARELDIAMTGRRALAAYAATG